MGKATLMTPLYVSVAWTMMITYQVFTQTAVSTVLSFFNVLWPAAGEWLLLRMDMIIFIYAFAWVFVLSSVIPSILLGKERSVLVQFFVCLTLTFVAFAIQDALNTYWGMPIEQLFSLAVVFHNPFLAVIYVLIPYILMLTIDIRSRRKKGKTKT